jgi:REP element-mobilizing transposase RayT
MTIDRRATGWLDPLHHARMREMLCHALARHGVVCATYCLMPDHGHFLLCGHSDSSDQRAAIRLFRQAWNRLLAPTYQLQRQAHDHVLREPQRDRGAFQTAAWYILENPVRAGLADEWAAWPYSSCLLPGWPMIDPRMPDYWSLFWKIWNGLSEAVP